MLSHTTFIHQAQNVCTISNTKIFLSQFSSFIHIPHCDPMKCDCAFSMNNISALAVKIECFIVHSMTLSQNLPKSLI